MKLYYSPGACSLASHIALREAGLPFELDKVDLGAKKTSAGEDFLQLNSKGYVPALRLDDGSVLTEGAVILQYIADRKPEAGLAPATGTMARYHLQEWLNFVAAEIHKTYSPLFGKSVPEEAKAHARTLLEKRLGHIEAALAGGPYLMGDRYTVADIYLFVVVGWSRLVGFDLGPFPRLQEFQGRIAARPAVQDALKAEGLLR